jgi:hypothetical protein
VFGTAQVGDGGTTQLVGDAVIVYALVYAVGVPPGARVLIPSLGPYESSPWPKILLISFTTDVPVSVQTENSSTVMFVANVKSFATRYSGERRVPFATEPTM